MQKKILVIDDEASIRDILSRAFTKAGYEVQVAENAEIALKMVKKDNIQVFFVDLLLPGMDGVELCRTIKKDRPTAFLFAMTGYASVFDLVKCREAGFDDYFPKPFDIEILLKIAREAFEKLDRWRSG